MHYTLWCIPKQPKYLTGNKWRHILAQKQQTNYAEKSWGELYTQALPNFDLPKNALPYKKMSEH